VRLANCGPPARPPHQPRHTAYKRGRRTETAQDSIYRLIEDLKRGDEQAALALWERYLPRLRAVANRTLSAVPRTAADQSDALQDAQLSFWKKAAAGNLPDDLNQNSLWGLLRVIVFRKALRQVRKGRVEVPEAAIPEFRIDDIFAQVSSADFDLHCEELLLKLDDSLRQIALLKLVNHKNKEIARLIGRSEKTVQRKLDLIRVLWNDELRG